MPYPYGMQNSPAVGNGLGGIPKRAAAEPREPLIVDYVSRLRTASLSLSYEVPSGYSKARLILVSRGSDYQGTGTFGGGKAVSPVFSVKAGTRIDLTFGSINTNVSTVSLGAFSMSVTDAETNSAGTATGGEQNFTGTSTAAGGVSGPNELGVIPTMEGAALPGASSPGAPGGQFSGSTIAGGQAMLRIIMW